jgi:hypothetical protein
MRTKNYFSLLISLFLFLSFSSKAQINWVQKYGRPNLTEKLTAIYPDEIPNQFWIAGQTGSVGKDDLFLMLVDSIGDRIWADTFGSPLHNEGIWAFHRDAYSGKMWISSFRKGLNSSESYTTLYGFEKDGSRTTTIEVPVMEPTYTIIALSDGGVLALLLTDYSENHVFKYTKEGDLVFDWLIDNSARTFARNSIEALQDGRFFIIYNTGPSIGRYAHAFLSFRNRDNSIIWEKEITTDTITGQTRGRNIEFFEQDSSIIITHGVNTSNNAISKFDINGQKVWEVPLDFEPRGNSRDIEMIKSEDNTFGLSYFGRSEIRDQQSGNLLKTIWYDDYQIEGTCFAKGGRLASVGNLDEDGKYALTSIADNETLYEKTIGTSGPPDEDSKAFIVESGNFIFLGSQVDNGNLQKLDFELRKIEKGTGTEVWTKTFGDTTSNILMDMIVLEDGSIMICTRVDEELANQPDIISFYKINPQDGSLIWRNELDNPRSVYSINMVALKDTGFVTTYLGTYIDPNDPDTRFSSQLLGNKFDKDGNKVWFQWYPDNWANNGNSPSGRGLRDLQCLDDQTIVGVSEEDGYAGLMLHFNSNDGSLINANKIDSTVGNENRELWNMVATNDGNWISVCINYNGNQPLYLYKTDPLGNILIRKEFFISSFHYGSRILKGKDGSIYLVLSFTASEPGGKRGINVYRLDDDLNILSTTEITNNLLRAYSAIVLEDNTLAISIVTTPTNSQDILIIKTEMIPLVKTTQILSKNHLKVFPNPTYGKQPLNFKIENDFIGKIQIQNLSGQLLYSLPFEKTTGSLTAEIPLRNLSEGTYLVTFIAGEEKVTEKFMVK